ncbi:HTTM domain-containing protein [Lewinella sp. IMCC34191]|uniref:HTTM domain-containing protein n=1 Tax=Lewinella sp. IMCC34191 TaxID=2259172 RepID=UPI000E272899|nr:HTTM domain-containing protein [Lewinella sp. IMCC34191]
MRTETSAAPLIVFRIGFGLMMLLSIIRFWAYGWIYKLYIFPDFFFSYRYFEWVKPLGEWTYALFAVAGLSAFCVMIGYRYRIAILVFFLSFTYIELMDKTTYLNHYYFVSLLAFLLVFIPIPAGLGAAERRKSANTFYRNALRIFVGVVYFYAGLAKLNSDWLLHAQPLATWLPGRDHFPLVGPLFRERWVHFAFAWAGAIYDLAIPFLLWWRRSRPVAFVLVVVFHVMTWVLFPIGMFPWIMIVSALIFFDDDAHRSIVASLRAVLPRFGTRTKTRRTGPYRAPALAQAAIVAVLAYHLLFPFRHLLQQDELFWTENGFRFSWRVMLIEKAGMATFRVEDRAGDQRITVNNREFLSTFQEKQMSTQPDFLLEFGHFLADHYRAQGFTEPAVYVESYVALNGRMSRAYVDPTVDLTTISPDDPPRTWLLPFEEDIYGF